MKLFATRTTYFFGRVVDRDFGFSLRIMCNKTMIILTFVCILFFTLFSYYTCTITTRWWWWCWRCRRLRRSSIVSAVVGNYNCTACRGSRVQYTILVHVQLILILHSSSTMTQNLVSHLTFRRILYKLNETSHTITNTWIFESRGIQCTTTISAIIFAFEWNGKEMFFVSTPPTVHFSMAHTALYTWFSIQFMPNASNQSLRHTQTHCLSLSFSCWPSSAIRLSSLCRRKCRVTESEAAQLFK